MALCSVEAVLFSFSLSLAWAPKDPKKHVKTSSQQMTLRGIHNLRNMEAEISWGCALKRGTPKKGYVGFSRDKGVCLEYVSGFLFERDFVIGFREGWKGGLERGWGRVGEGLGWGVGQG